MILSDEEIKKLSLEQGMIEPFDDTRLTKVSGKISWGVSSYGYDMRISNEFYFPKEEKNILIDPKNFDLKKFQMVKSKDQSFVIPAKTYILARSLEYFKIPRNILVIVFGKSTYARCGLIVNVTPLEPEWEGYVTISIVNPLDHRIKIYFNEGIAQLIFLKSKNLCKISYKDKVGKYQAQKVVTPPK
jgi:dCTP deaminase